MSRLLLPIALLCAVLALAACGGSGGDSSGSATGAGEEALSKPEWIAAADEICTEEQKEEEPLEAELEATSEEPETPEQLESLADLSRELLALVEGETASIRELQPPVGDEETIDVMLSTVEGSVPLGEEFADAIEAGDVEGIGASQAKLEANSEKGQNLAQAYGLKVCGSGE